MLFQILRTNYRHWFLWGLYNDCATLQTIINGTSDYVVGDDITCTVQGFEKVVNKQGETIKDIIQRIAVDYILFGSFAVQVIRNVMGNVSEIYWVDINKLRSDEKNEVFFYDAEASIILDNIEKLVWSKDKEKRICNNKDILVGVFLAEIVGASIIRHI